MNIRLEAYATVAYGFEFTWGNSESGIGCALTFTPFVNPYISAYGGLDLKVYRAGLFFDGYIANTSLEFYADVQI